jgi:uncharacterized damage-inducible protein DinB
MESEAVVQTWEIHNRIVLYFLEAIAPAQLTDVATTKGRNVGEQLAHVHNVRLMWLKVAAPELFKKQKSIEKEAAADQELLRRSLTDSGKAIAQLLQQSLAADGKIKGFKPHATAFVGYLIAHEAHHRAQVVLILKQNGHPVDKKVSYGIWEWGTKQ